MLSYADSRMLQEVPCRDTDPDPGLSMDIKVTIIFFILILIIVTLILIFVILDTIALISESTLVETLGSASTGDKYYHATIIIANITMIHGQ